jgi:hypothetical protein
MKAHGPRRAIALLEISGDGVWGTYRIRNQQVRIQKDERGLRAVTEEQEIFHECEITQQSISDFIVFLHDDALAPPVVRYDLQD